MENNQNKSVNAKKQRKWRAILITLVTLAIFGILVIGHFLYKSCGSSKPTKSLNIKIIQPEDTWELKVNNQTDNLKVNKGDQLNVVVKSKISNKDILSYYTSEQQDNVPTNDNAYYAKVTKLSHPTEEIGKSGQLIYDQALKQYSTSFLVTWDVDAILQIAEKTNYEGDIYTKEDGKVVYTYDSTIYDSTQKIRRINNKTSPASYEEVDRDKFNDPLWIGSENRVIYSSFLANCTAFNSNITFNEGALTTIEDNFMFGCTEFNKPIVFPNSLTGIRGNFMYGCSKFNQEIDTKNIQYIGGDEFSSFLKDCAAFNSKVTLGNSLLYLGDNFLQYCKAFNQTITIPAKITHLGNYFLHGCDQMISPIVVQCKPEAFTYGSQYICATDNPNAPCFKQGMKATGTYAQQWVDAFPYVEDKTRDIYRKVVLA